MRWIGRFIQDISTRR